VIPKALRDQLGIGPGEVDIVADGAALRVEAVVGSGLAEQAGRLVIPSGGVAVSDDDVQRLRAADQK